MDWRTKARYDAEAWDFLGFSSMKLAWILTCIIADRVVKPAIKQLEAPHG